MARIGAVEQNVGPDASQPVETMPDRLYGEIRGCLSTESRGLDIASPCCRGGSSSLYVRQKYDLPAARSVRRTGLLLLGGARISTESKAIRWKEGIYADVIG